MSDHRARGLPELLRPGTDVGHALNTRFLLALIVGANRDGARAALTATLRKSYDRVGALSSEDRNRRLEEIDAELDRLERDEERIIRASEADGAGILRREDADPAVVLLADLAA